VVCIQRRRAEAQETDSVTEGVRLDTVRTLEAEVVEVVVGQVHSRVCVHLALRYSRNARRDREARDQRNH
jgi:hypothetical protein